MFNLKNTASCRNVSIVLRLQIILPARTIIKIFRQYLKKRYDLLKLNFDRLVHCIIMSFFIKDS